jgi:WD40 repeat protein
VTPDGSHIISASMDGTIKVWDFESTSEKETLKGDGGSVGALSLSPRSLLLASASFGKRAYVWDWRTFQVAAVLGEDFAAFPIGLAFHPSNPILATVGEGGNVIHIWELDIERLLNIAQAEIKEKIGNIRR